MVFYRIHGNLSFHGVCLPKVRKECLINGTSKRIQNRESKTKLQVIPDCSVLSILKEMAIAFACIVDPKYKSISQSIFPAAFFNSPTVE
jgi:hypothetical protein